MPMFDGILEMSARNQVIVMTPFTLAGAMAPVTLAARWPSRTPRPWLGWS